MNTYFKTSCYIKNINIGVTLEILKTIGYKTLSCYNYTKNSLYVIPQGVVYPEYPKNELLQEINIKESDFIDCGNNQKLFLTLAAMSDINDYMQLFVNIKSGKYLICDKLQFGNYITIGELLKTDILLEVEFRNLSCHKAINKINDYIKQNFRKATKEEIIEYFSIKNY